MSYNYLRMTDITSGHYGKKLYPYTSNQQFQEKGDKQNRITGISIKGTIKGPCTIFSSRENLAALVTEYLKKVDSGTIVTTFDGVRQPPIDIFEELRRVENPTKGIYVSNQPYSSPFGTGRVVSTSN